MTTEQENVISLVQLTIKPGETVDEARIETLVSFFSQINNLSKEGIKETIAELQTRLAVRMDRGSFVAEKDHVSWYFSAKKDITPQYWKRYSTYLLKKMNSDVINSMDQATDEMMDLISNPKEEGAFQRRGLVIGDVQSGKTSTYLALMNKAADAGYRIIILLTGVIEKLRRQTQGRVDEGFVGLDSSAFNNKNSNRVYVGVGALDSRFTGWAVTSTTNDFNKSTGRQLVGQLSSITDPVVFVLKKNKSVLEELARWLEMFNANQSGKIDMPLLLIDDEADNASVSTKPGEDPTTINKDIRKILALFSKASYVGFTATPYANIFIDPDSSQEMLGQDLFPRHFIYALEAPTNYIGAADIFPVEGRYHRMIHDNSDCESYVPLKHKKSFQPDKMPLSLKKAIASFMLVNAIRDLRNQKEQHRTMMINISVYIDVQKIIAEQINSYVRDVQREIQNYYKMGEMALQYSSFSFLKDVYDEFYSECGVEWKDIQSVLKEAIAPIVVRYVNGGNAAKNLNYDENKESELRIIAVGGYSLSRGLTLEGLSNSYFYRNTKMYDTLMQMGRWFGYRAGYEDLCQVWINKDAVEWYSYISEASEELKREVRRMQAEQRTPADFGLCVRSDKAALMVTARNKMRTAKDYTLTVSLSGNIIETPFIHSDSKIQNDNLRATQLLFDKISNDGYIPVYGDDRYALSQQYQYLNIPVSYILDYLHSYQSHGMNSNFHTNEIAELIRKDREGIMENWDIVIASGSGKRVISLGGHTICCVQRSFAVREDLHAYQMSGSKSRLGNRSYAKGGLLKSTVKKIEDAEYALQKRLRGETRALNQNVFFKPDYYDTPRNPLLVIYPVELKAPEKLETPEEFNRFNITLNVTTPLIGISVGIPSTREGEVKRYQYKINLIKYREVMGFDEDDTDETDETIED